MCTPSGFSLQNSDESLESIIFDFNSFKDGADVFLFAKFDFEFNLVCGDSSLFSNNVNMVNKGNVRCYNKLM